MVQFIEMDDLDEFYEKAKIVGEIVQEKHETFYGTKEFSMRDINGYVLMFAERIK